MGWIDPPLGSTSFSSSNKEIFASAEQAEGVVQTGTFTMVPNPGRVRGLVIIIDVTANAGGAGSVQVNIYGVDPASGKKWLLLASATLSAITTTVLRIHPDLAASANLIAQDVIPETIEVVATGGVGGPITYSVGGVQVG